MSERNNGRIAFLNSPYILKEDFHQHMPPLSLLYLATYMKSNGFDVRIYNLDRFVRDKGFRYLGYNLNSLFNNLSLFNPQMIGITCQYSARWPFVQRLIEIIKRWFKDIPVVIGGIHPTCFPEYCLCSSKADYIILGEGEFSCLELFKHVLSRTTPSGLDGVAFRDNSKIICNPKKSFITDLDTLPFPDYSLIDINRYKQLCRKDYIAQLKGMYFPVLTSRSCPNQCRYCNLYLVHGRKWRARSPDNVVKELSYLVETYKVRQFAFVDDNFSFSRERTIAILKEIVNGKIGPIKFIPLNGLSVKTLDDEVIWYLKKAGALEVSLAIESGSEYIRNTVYNKKVSTKKIIEVVRACKKYNLICKAFFMVGAPEETDDTIKESIDLMREIRIPASFSITTPFKGTKLYDYYMKKKLISEDELKRGYFLDLRLPIGNTKSYTQIIQWRRKLMIYNIWYSLPELLKHSKLLTFHNFNRLLATVLFPKKLTMDIINYAMDKYMPLFRYRKNV